MCFLVLISLWLFGVAAPAFHCSQLACLVGCGELSLSATWKTIVGVLAMAKYSELHELLLVLLSVICNLLRLWIKLLHFVLLLAPALIRDIKVIIRAHSYAAKGLNCWGIFYHAPRSFICPSLLIHLLEMCLMLVKALLQ